MLALLAITAPTLADTTTSSDAPQEQARTWRLPPLRVDNRIVVRPNTAGTALLEVGMQAARTRRLAFDVNLSLAPAANLRLPGSTNWRNMSTLSAGVDALWEPSPFLSAGPSLNADLRWFRQQSTDVGTTVIPTLGLRTNLHLLRGRWYSVCLTLKGAYDLIPTDLVIETAEIRRLNPFTAQAGVRVNFGHGRYRERG